MSCKIIVTEFVTLDGVVEDPDGTLGTPFGGWAVRHGQGPVVDDKFRLGPILDTGALLFGRVTWEIFSQRWPARTGDFAAVMNRIPKLVASRTLESVEAWSNSVLLDGELTDAVARATAERDLVVVGSTSVVHQLAAAGVVDEYRMLVFPTVVGAGERLFADGIPAELQLVSVDATDPAVLLRYTVAQQRERAP